MATWLTQWLTSDGIAPVSSSLRPPERLPTKHTCPEINTVLQYPRIRIRGAILHHLICLRELVFRHSDILATYKPMVGASDLYPRGLVFEPYLKGWLPYLKGSEIFLDPYPTDGCSGNSVEFPAILTKVCCGFPQSLQQMYVWGLEIGYFHLLQLAYLTIRRSHSPC
jgi:hypothetical protein